MKQKTKIAKWILTIYLVAGVIGATIGLLLIVYHTITQRDTDDIFALTTFLLILIFVWALFNYND
jgi:hypothetical protein